jgi:hypothetical protein
MDRLMHLTMNEAVKRVGWFIRMSALTGPWRPLLLFCCRRMHSAPPLPTTAKTILPDLSPERTAETLRRDGWAQHLRVPEPQLNAILQYTRDDPRQRYENPHLHCQALRELALDPAVVDVVRRYIGGEPYLYHSVIWKNVGVERPEEVEDSHLYQFHFDVADVKSLVLFAYLTDVDENCGPHEVVSGTHGRRSLWKIARIYVGEHEIRKRYPGRVNLIVGSRGTAFFEEQTVYHRQAMPRKARMMLRITYTLWRAPKHS